MPDDRVRGLVNSQLSATSSDTSDEKAIPGACGSLIRKEPCLDELTPLAESIKVETRLLTRSKKLPEGPPLF